MPRERYFTEHSDVFTELPMGTETKQTPRSKNFEELANLLDSPNKRIVRHSARLLQERSGDDEMDEETVNNLRNKKDGKEIQTRLQGLWTLHATGYLKENEVRSL